MNQNAVLRSIYKLLSVVLLLSLLISVCTQQASAAPSEVQTTVASLPTALDPTPGSTGASLPGYLTENISYLGMIFTFPGDWVMQPLPYRDFGFRISSPDISVDPLGRPLSGGFMSASVEALSAAGWDAFLARNPGEAIQVAGYTGVMLSGIESETFPYTEWHFYAYNRRHTLKFVGSPDRFDSLSSIAAEMIAALQLTGTYESAPSLMSPQGVSAQAWNNRAILNAFSYGPGKIINDYNASSHTGSLDYGLDICGGAGCNASTYNDIVYAPTDIKLVLSTYGYNMPTSSRDYHLFEVTYDFGGKLCLAMGHFAITISGFTPGKTLPRQAQIGRIINYTPSVNHIHMNLYSVPMDQSCGSTTNRVAVPFDSTRTDLRGQSLDGVDYHIGTSYRGNTITSTVYGICAVPYDSAADVRAAADSQVQATVAGCDDPSNDNASFVSDVTVPDGTTMSPGQAFTKTWRMKNTGTTTWGAGYSWVYTGGDQMGAPASVSVPATSPNNTVDISVNMTAPGSGGSYTGYWQMKNPQGQLFGSPVWVKISVSGSPPPSGWHVEYFNQKTFGDRCYDGSESSTYIFKNWGGGPPSGSCNSDNFSARFTRTINFPGGYYSFHCQHDDGCRIYIDGQMRGDWWWDGYGGHDWGGSISGGNHEVRIEFYDSGGDARLEAFWSGPGFLPTGPGCSSEEWCASYYGNRDLSGTPAIRRSEGTSNVDHEWGDGGIGYGFPNDNFSVRWQRNVSFDPGRYRFHIRVDDGGRLWVNNSKIIDQWKDQGVTEYTAEVDLNSRAVPISFEYYENGGGAIAQMWWETLQSYVDNAQFVSQSPYPRVAPGEPYEIYFEVKNNGNTTWQPGSFWLQNVQHPLGANPQQALSQPVPPDSTYRWTISQTAPSAAGTYRSQWMISHNGVAFGPNLFIDVTVGSTSSSFNLLIDGGFEEGNATPTWWSYDAWTPDNSAALWDSAQKHAGNRSLKLSNNVANDARWIQTVQVQPNAEYRLSGWIKTENVAHSQEANDHGAHLSTLSPLWSSSGGLFGTNDWSYVSYTFNTGANTEITIAARLGTYSGTNTGTAWFDDLKLELLSTPQCYTLTRAANPGGSVTASPAPNCANGTKYIHGTVVKLTANPVAGYTFDHWEGDVTGPANPAYVTMTAATSVTGNFVEAAPGTFGDVPGDYWARDFVERLFSAGITGGCSVSPLNYCPEATVTRAQMAVFLERGVHGSAYNPPAVGGNTGFSDVPPGYWAAAWIQQLAADGITGGCAAGAYCPEAPVTRAQMAVFLLRSKYGASYTPPGVGSSTGFSDVPPGYWAAAWVKQLVAENITSGCGAGTYCPESPVTRAQMAVFLVKTFNLP